MEDGEVSGSDGEVGDNGVREWVPLIRPGCGRVPGSLHELGRVGVDGWMDVEDDLDTRDVTLRPF